MATELELEESRAASGQLFVSFRAGFYQGFFQSTQARHGMPKGIPGDNGYVASFIPGPDNAIESSDGTLKLVAMPINLLTEEDIEELNLSHPNTTEISEDEYEALL